MNAHHERKRVGLIGYPVEHSLSPAMHNAAFAHFGLDWHYDLLPTHPDDFDARIAACIQEGFAGWNITVPHKQLMLNYLHTMSPEVEATGACNTVRVENGRLIGFNTDIAGFLMGLELAGGIENASEVVVLGAGGSARAVVYALAKAGHRVTILARNAEQAAALAETFSHVDNHIHYEHLTSITLNIALQTASLLVNCTPAGMWPSTETTPLPEGTQLTPRTLIYDLVYRPRPTRLLKEADMAGCRTQDGLAMLAGQGAEAFALWTGCPAPHEIMMQACLDVKRETRV